MLLIWKWWLFKQFQGPQPYQCETISRIDMVLPKFHERTCQTCFLFAWTYLKGCTFSVDYKMPTRIWRAKIEIDNYIILVKFNFKNLSYLMWIALFKVWVKCCHNKKIEGNCHSLCGQRFVTSSKKLSSNGGWTLCFDLGNLACMQIFA
jgi:hypothetical protein